MTEAVAIAADRSMLVPPGRFVRTGYVDVFKVRHACRERMASGDVDRAFQKVLQLGENGAWPPPRGYWDGDTFVLEDGRHAHIGAVMAGHSHMFVAWLD